MCLCRVVDGATVRELFACLHPQTLRTASSSTHLTQSMRTHLSLLSTTCPFCRHHFGGLSYEGIDGLQYIDAVFTETLRCVLFGA